MVRHRVLPDVAPHVGAAPPRQRKHLDDRPATDLVALDEATGKSLFGPQQISALFTGVPGLCGQGQTFSISETPTLACQRWLGEIES